MSHNTMVDGTVYEISGGRTLVNGTGYSIDKGKTLVGGTVYEVGFAPTEATVTINGHMGNSSIVYVEINNVAYANGTSSVVVPIGTVITCRAQQNDSGKYGLITVNGRTAAQDNNGTGVTYDYTVIGNVVVTMNFAQGGGSVNIIELPEGHAVVSIKGSGNISFGTYITIDGVDYTTAQNKTFPIGTIITCYAKLNATDSQGEIWFNGYIEDKDYEGEGITYAYTLNGNTIIELRSGKGGGSVYITEQ